MIASYVSLLITRRLVTEPGGIHRLRPRRLRRRPARLPKLVAA